VKTEHNIDTNSGTQSIKLAQFISDTGP